MAALPTLQNQRPIELLKTCVIVFICDIPPHSSLFPLTLTSFTQHIKSFIMNMDKIKPYLVDLLRIPYITNHHHANENKQQSSLTLNKLIESSSFNELLLCIKQIVIEIELMDNELLHLSTSIDNPSFYSINPNEDKTVILCCNPALFQSRFDSLLKEINHYKTEFIEKQNSKQSISSTPNIPKKRRWHEVHDEDLIYSDNHQYPLAKRLRIDIADSEHNKKILQRLPLSATSNNPNKTIAEIQEEISDLLDYKSHENMSHLDTSLEIINILRTPTTKQILINNLYSTKNNRAVNEFCEFGTKHECKMNRRDLNSTALSLSSLSSLTECNKIHFIRIMRPHTMPTLGDCSYLDGCRHMDTCRFIHYVIDEECVAQKKSYFRARKFVNKLLKENKQDINGDGGNVGDGDGNHNKKNHGDTHHGDESDSTSVDFTVLSQQIYQNPAIHRYEAQWVNCDVRALDFNVLGKFGVIMADPPWDIHMELPYGTLTDEEMLDLNVGQLADENCLLFLWVTGRVMETARKCMKRWGFLCQEEILWIKTNQLQRIIRTGRTGHWLNHSKEHCLVGVKGNDIRWNRCIDCDIIVAEVRETSRKPDEIYNLIERLSPGTKKIEIFGRPHNTRPGWMTLGNQLNGTRILDKKIYKKFHAFYPTIHVKTSVDTDSSPQTEEEESDTSPSVEEESDSGSSQSDDESDSASQSDESSSSSSSATDSGSESSSSDSSSQSSTDTDMTDKK